MSAYGPHERLVTPGRSSAGLWRLAGGIVLAVLVMFALSRAMFAIFNVVLSPERYLALSQSVERADTPLGLLILLVTMGTMGIGAMAASEILHRRPAATLFGPWDAFRSQFTHVLIAMTALLAVLGMLPPWGLPEGTTRGLDSREWLGFLPVTLLALLVQCGSEELFFRGYLQSQIAARFRNAAVWMVVPSALFAFGHYAPEIYGPNAAYVSLWAFCFGLAAADLTARSGTLGPAIAIHVANNFVGVALVSMAGEMSGLALYNLPFTVTDANEMRQLLPLDLAYIFVSWLAARLALQV